MGVSPLILVLTSFTREEMPRFVLIKVCVDKGMRKPTDFCAILFKTTNAAEISPSFSNGMP